MKSPLAPARCTAAVVVIATLAGCATAKSAAVSCKSGEQTAVQDLLYFGTEKPSGRVTPQDWAQFLGEAVTPRFPDGLTAWQAWGQWRSAAGEVVQEPSYVLSLVHPDSAANEQAIGELVASYKSRFQQEAVLRVKFHACMSL
jgi:hypothetical protein